MLAFFMQAHAIADTARAVAKSTQEWNLTGVDSIVAGNGLTISIVGIAVVFSALIIMSGTIYYIVVLSQWFSRRGSNTSTVTPVIHAKSAITGELVAAIAMALEQQIFQIHDEEDAVLTIKRVSRPYSPWSSKLHGMTQPPFRTTT